ncbi:uncharacterized protein [Amphiura filiformis]|uniref:uncharacterized protein n=1 Tax=Amphiura filiformis TaxID=82378 RepID=UPI003B2109B1
MKILSTILMGILAFSMVFGYQDPLTRETKEDAPDAQTINKRATRICDEDDQRHNLFKYCGGQVKREVDVKDALAFLQLRDEFTMVKRKIKSTALEYMQEECCEETCLMEEISEIKCPFLW